MTVVEQAELLLQTIRSMESVAVAFSGGVDSSVVAKASALALADRAIAITADSASVPRQELADAQALAQSIGIQHRIVSTEEFRNPDYLKNAGDRCYFCKDELYSRIEELLPQLEAKVICSGANLDDQGDYRPGLTAAARHQVRHPLQEAGFTKADVRRLAQYWQLPVWDKPASPCLSSRLAPGLEVTAERTQRVELAEKYLKSQGLRDCRVRYHPGDLARIELPIEAMAQFVAPGVREALAAYFRELGFQFITLDLEGFRTGSLNALVNLDVKKKYKIES